jgi:hypothetical protein
MCIPIAIAAAAMSAIGTGVGAIASSNAANYRAKVADRNAALEVEAANQENQNTREKALEHYRKVAALKGQQAVGAAANGVLGGFGTAADTYADTEMLGREDAGRIYQQGFQNVRSRDTAAWNQRAQANAARSEGSNALLKGAFDFGSTVLGGVQQYQRLRQAN